MSVSFGVDLQAGQVSEQSKVGGAAIVGVFLVPVMGHPSVVADYGKITR